MEIISIHFDEEVAYNVAITKKCALEITLPEPIDERVWERLLVIKEVSYPLPIIVTFSPTWVEIGLEPILTRLAASYVSGVKLKKFIDNTPLLEINQVNNLGLALIYSDNY